MSHVQLLHKDSQVFVWRVSIPAGGCVPIFDGEFGDARKWKFWWCSTLQGKAALSPEQPRRLNPRAMWEYRNLQTAPPLAELPVDGSIEALREATGAGRCVVVVCAVPEDQSEWQVHAQRDRDAAGHLKGHTYRSPPSGPGLSAVATALLYEDGCMRVWDQWLPPHHLDKHKHVHSDPYWLFTLGFAGCKLESPGVRADGEKGLIRFGVEKPMAMVVSPGRTEAASNMGPSPYRAVLVESKLRGKL
eukprot:TRINITY_DN1827_c3_g2_i1.p1 TRINITY_DN1827_c3_g2~~TRINITY_DN1827_c3_g2_i1.p1  ORF type:complete len:246 (+),score=43.07 TRINITY_DN1827_c3_g2_i1:83-820(+)